MNLCIVCLDALREDHVRPDIMPHLCELLATGRRYTNVWTKSAWTPTPNIACGLLVRHGSQDLAAVETKLRDMGYVG